MSGIRIAIVHGYFLGDSGSAVYVRELAREFCRQGHEVTLVCQEREAGRFSFIDSVFDLDDQNTTIVTRSEGEGMYQGTCRLVRPSLDGNLLTYVPGPFPGFRAVAFQEASVEAIDDYVARNLRGLGTIFSRWHPDLVQANHVVMQPYVVNRVLAGAAPFAVTIHGSALNFSVKADDRLVPFAMEGLMGATMVGTLSGTSRDDVVSFAAEQGLDIDGKTKELPPGVDTGLMRPLAAGERAHALGGVSTGINPDIDDVAVFAGRLLWSKGIHYAVAAMPLILASRPGMHLVVVGEGPMEQPLRHLIKLLDAGLLAEARELVEENAELRAGEGFGPVIPELSDSEMASYVEAGRDRIGSRIHFTGHLTHEQLAPIYGAADVSLAPSVFPEAFALVSIEALAGGCLPVVTYQTGLRAAADTVSGELEDPSFRELAPGQALTGSLAVKVTSLLERYPTRDPSFRSRLHALADRLFSWSNVAARYIEYLVESGR